MRCSIWGQNQISMWDTLTFPLELPKGRTRPPPTEKSSASPARPTIGKEASATRPRIADLESLRALMNLYRSLSLRGSHDEGMCSVTGRGVMQRRRSLSDTAATLTPAIRSLPNQENIQWGKKVPIPRWERGGEEYLRERLSSRMFFLLLL